MREHNIKIVGGYKHVRKEKQENCKLTDELSAARAALDQMHAEYEMKLNDAKADINARRPRSPP